MQKLIIATATILTLVIAGCASERRFMPTGSVTSPSPDDQRVNEQARQDRAFPYTSPMDDRGD
jgi:hypothetical protein